MKSAGGIFYNDALSRLLAWAGNGCRTGEFSVLSDYMTVSMCQAALREDHHVCPLRDPFVDPQGVVGEIFFMAKGCGNPLGRYHV